MAEEKDAEKDEKDGADKGAKKGGGLKRIIILLSNSWYFCRWHFSRIKNDSAARSTSRR